MTVIETLLAETFGVPATDPRVRGVIKALDGVIDHRALVREMIRRDPCTDYKVLTIRYHCSPQTVYRAWAEILPARERG